LIQKFVGRALLLILTPVASYSFGLVFLPLAALLHRKMASLGLLAGILCLWLMNPYGFGFVGGLLSLGVYFWLSQTTVTIPRLKHVFYAAYPLHLLILKCLFTYFHH
jgi:hypothetical protein